MYLHKRRYAPSRSCENDRSSVCVSHVFYDVSGQTVAECILCIYLIYLLMLLNAVCAITLENGRNGKKHWQNISIEYCRAMPQLDRIKPMRQLHTFGLLVLACLRYSLCLQVPILATMFYRICFSIESSRIIDTDAGFIMKFTKLVGSFTSAFLLQTDTVCGCVYAAVNSIPTMPYFKLVFSFIDRSYACALWSLHCYFTAINKLMIKYGEFQLFRHLICRMLLNRLAC